MKNGAVMFNQAKNSMEYGPDFWIVFGLLEQLARTNHYGGELIIHVILVVSYTRVLSYILMGLYMCLRNTVVRHGADTSFW